MLDETVINNAYGQLNDTRQKLFDAHVQSLEAQRFLNKKKTELVASGVIDGKNEEARKAQVASMTEAETNMVFEAEKKLDVSQLDHEFANYEVNRINTLIKWLK
jgi:hypothetical protein